MDSENQWQRWLSSQRTSTSPSRHSSSQPALAQSEAGPSNWQERGKRLTLCILSVSNASAGSRNDRWNPVGWQAPPSNCDQPPTGTSTTATSRGKRRRRLSSLDEAVHRQGIAGEDRGRDYHRPPATRQRVAIDSDDVSSFNCFFTRLGAEVSHRSRTG
jgi:hypothetical protein